MLQTTLDESESITIPEHQKFRRSWRWPHPIEEFFRLHFEGWYSLNVCCGQSSIGNVRVDIDPESKANVIADMRALPFEDNIFDRVGSDPYWQMGYYQRFRPWYELVRVCKIGGLIIHNATWVCESNQAVEIERYSRSDVPFGVASVISVFRKIPKIE